MKRKGTKHKEKTQQKLCIKIYKRNGKNQMKLEYKIKYLYKVFIDRKTTKFP